MNAQSDQQLVRDYAEERSDAAFAELVRRHVDLVYSAALRMVCETHTAEDVTQNVFLTLAQHAPQLTQHPVLSGWLHVTTRNLAAKAVRTEVRRQAREQEAVAMNELLSNHPDASWEEIAPHLDAALAELSETDRDAVMLRYFEKKTAAEVAQTLGISAEAAQKRMNRAVERLRENFNKRNVGVGAGALGILITANAVQSAPIGLAAAITTTVTVTAAAATTTTTSTIITATKAIAMTTIQKIVVTATVAALAGVGIFEAKQAAQLRNQMQTMQQGQTDLTDQLAKLEADNTRLSNQVAHGQEQKQLSQSQLNELLKLRGQKGQSQTALQELAKMQANQGKNGFNSPFMTNAMKMGLSFAQMAQEKKAQAKLARMKDKLQLSDDQMQAIKGIMLQHIDENNERSMAMLSGQKPVIDPNEPTEDSQIQAVLTSDQMTEWPDFQQSEKQVNAQDSAKADVALMESSVDLSPDQQSQAQAALYQYELNQMSGATNQAALVAQTRSTGDIASADNMAIDLMRQQLADKVKLLDGILTPDQLKAYQQNQQDMLDMQASAMKMFLPGTNSAVAGQ